MRVDDGTYWDGLFSQNPPVRDLPTRDPDEIWVIQINPTEADAEPRTVMDIANRRNELAGNLSLYQELHFIEKIDQLLAEGCSTRTGGTGRSSCASSSCPGPAVSRCWGPASKLNRDPGSCGS